MSTGADEWLKFGERVVGILTKEQQDQIIAWHDEIPEAYSGCTARDEGSACCIDAITTAQMTLGVNRDH